MIIEFKREDIAGATKIMKTSKLEITAEEWRNLMKESSFVDFLWRLSSQYTGFISVVNQEKKK